MIRVIVGKDVSRHRRLFDRVYRTRHQIFVDQMGWTDLRRMDGIEKDQFDTDRALHFIALQDERIAAYSRLLPTMGPHLLSDVYPELLAGASAPRRPDVYEWTRLFTDDWAQPGNTMSPAGRALFVALAEYCGRAGISSLIAQSGPMSVSRLLQLGWEARPLAMPTVYRGQPVVAFEAHLLPETVARSRKVLGVKGDVFIQPDALLPWMDDQAGVAAEIMH